MKREGMRRNKMSDEKRVWALKSLLNTIRNLWGGKVWRVHIIKDTTHENWWKILEIHFTCLLFHVRLIHTPTPNQFCNVYLGRFIYSCGEVQNILWKFLSLLLCKFLNMAFIDMLLEYIYTTIDPCTTQLQQCKHWEF